MVSTPTHHALTPRREFATLLALCAVQFTHILDFMIMMPLAPQLMRIFQITPAQFTVLLASYGLSAAVSGFLGGFMLDRYDRKNALLVLYAGFGVATLGCGLAPSHHWLLAARIAAGAFGGLAGSLVTAMIGDVIPPTRRGRAMGFVMSAFPVASVFGIFAGLELAGRFGWHAPFLLLAGCALLNLAFSSFALPHIKTAVHDHQPLRQMREILAHRTHRWAFAVGSVLIMAGGVLIPFLAPSFIVNVHIDEVKELKWVYAAGGLATFFSMPLVGRLSDRVDRLHLLAVMSALAVAVTLAITRLGPSSLAFGCVMMALFMVTMSGRFAPAMTMITNSVEPRYRGGFMSVNAALQQAASGVANVVAGVFITLGPTGELVGFPTLGYVAVGFFILTVLLAAKLCAHAPHVAKSSRVAAPQPAEAAA